MKKLPRTLVGSEQQRDDAPELHCCFGSCVSLCVCVCVRVVLLNVANSDAYADGSGEMVSVSNVPLAL